MNMNELKNCKRISLFHSSGYVSRINANTPSFAHSYKVVYTTKTGKEVVIGQARHSRKDSARKAALDAALSFMNEA